jgi:hypothetical protein
MMAKLTIGKLLLGFISFKGIIPVKDYNRPVKDYIRLVYSLEYALYFYK